MKRSGGIWFGMILVAIGALLLLDNMEIVDFGEVVHTYWPLLLVIWGLSMLLRRSSSQGVPDQPCSSTPSGQASDANRLSTSTVFGDCTMAVQSQTLMGGSVSTTFGDIHLDLLNARLAEGEQVLKVDGVFGDTELRLPKDMAFAVHAATTMGDVRVNEQLREGVSPSIDYESPDFATAPRRLRIVATRVFGDVIVSA